jgi:hypothetical protein
VRGCPVTLTTEDMGRLRFGLAALDGFDPVGLTLGRGGEWAACVAYGHSDGTVLLVRGAGTRHVVTEWWPLAGFEVDLADAATRDRVARWLAARVGLEVGSTAPGWETGDIEPVEWVLVGTRIGDHFTPDSVPALAAVDPDDRRRLADGSLYRDALALALVAVHVGGAP